MPVPRFWSGELTEADLSPSFALPSTAIAQAQIVPNQLGLPVINKSGGTIAAGALVYVTGYDATSGRLSVTKASAAAVSSGAAYVALAQLLNNASGTVGKHLTLTGQNTNSATAAGDPVYLDTTAGGYTVTNPPAAPSIYQQVGRVAVKSATVGVVEFDLSSFPAILEGDRQAVFFPTIATTGNTNARIVMPVSALILGFKGVFGSNLTADNTNFLTFSVTNLGQASGGTTALLATSPAGINTTKVTGGTALAVDTAYVFTVTSTAADLVVAGGDILRFRCAASGTLANSVIEGMISAVYFPI